MFSFARMCRVVLCAVSAVIVAAATSLAQADCTCSQSMSYLNGLPYHEGFERGRSGWSSESGWNGWGYWTQVPSDNPPPEGGDYFDWRRNSGPPPLTPHTGPTAAHGGDWYVYMQAQGHVGWPDHQYAEVESPCFRFPDHASNERVSFWYCLHGPGLGILRLRVSTDGNCTHFITKFNLEGEQGTGWHQTTVDLSSTVHGKTFKLRFYAEIGSSIYSDIAIDDVEVTADYDCNGNRTIDTVDISNGTSRDCNRNDIPDECEIKTGSASGGPFYCSEYCDPDCNHNGVPDACDFPQRRL